MRQLYIHLNQHLGGYLREFLAWGRVVLYGPSSHESKFVIFGRGRSGSTLLSDLLNNLKEVDCDKEIFNRRVLMPRGFLKNRNSIFRKPVYGFKLLSYQLQQKLDQENGKKFLEYLVNSEGYKVVYIKRQNIVRQTLSKHYARFRRAWHQDTPLFAPPKMQVDIPSFMAELRATQALQEYEDYCLSDIPHFKVIYEQDLQHRESRLRLLDRLSYFIGTKVETPRTSLHKISPQRFDDYIANWQDLKACLTYTEFATEVMDRQ